MTECRSPELQDLLPEYLADRLDDVTSARVAGHVASCAACADDLSVLRVVRQARPRVAVPDIARIVAALPTAPAASAQVMPTGPRLVRDEAPIAPSVPPSVQRPTKRGSVFGLSVWRLAATLGVVIAGGASMLVARRGLTGLSTTADIAGDRLAESTTVVAVGPSPARAESAMVRPASVRPTSVSVSYGDLGDYSEDELQQMLDRLDQWDGATSTEPLPGVPILPSSGGGTP